MSATTAPLAKEIARRIQAEGAIPFETFMEAALYHPSLGYYCRDDRDLLGPRGDYRTGPEISPVFGRLLARQVAEILDRTGGAGMPLRVVEVGPGRGTLARDLALALTEERPDLAQRTGLVLVEVSPVLMQMQQRTLRDLPCGGAGQLRGMTWSTWDDLLDGDDETASCVVANEFLDALPVRIARRVDGRLKEVHVDAGGVAAFAETLREPVDGRLAAHFERLERVEGVHLAEGQKIEAGLRGLAWVASLARLFGPRGRGGAVIIDYGRTARDLYDPARADGTLMCYHRHRALQDPYTMVGEQDITAHVDFTSIAHSAREAGLDVAGPVSQMRFLVALGLAQIFARRAGEITPDAIQDRLGLHALMAPGGMGEIFSAMLLTRGTEAALLTGARDPFRPLPAEAAP